MDIKLFPGFIIALILYCQQPGAVCELLNTSQTGLHLLHWRFLLWGTMVSFSPQQDTHLRTYTLTYKCTQSTTEITWAYETLFPLDLLSSLIILKGAKKILHLSSIMFPFEHFSIWNHEPISLKKHSEANAKGMGYRFIGLGLLVFEKININLKWSL